MWPQGPAHQKQRLTPAWPPRHTLARPKDLGSGFDLFNPSTNQPYWKVRGFCLKSIRPHSWRGMLPCTSVRGTTLRSSGRVRVHYATCVVNWTATTLVTNWQSMSPDLAQWAWAARGAQILSLPRPAPRPPQVCGGIAAIAAKCKETKGCEAFTL